MNNIISKIYKNYKDYTDTEKKIADYILGHHNEIQYDTLNTLATKIKTSTTSVIRFARQIGLSGYKELLDEIRSYASISDPFSVVKNYENIKDASISELFQKSAQQEISNIDSTFSGVNPKEIEKAISLLNTSRNIYLVGQNDSFTLAYYMTLRLAQVRPNIHLLQAVGNLYPMEIASSNKNDLLLAYLFPRYSMTTVDIIQQCRSQGCQVIIISGGHTAKIKDFADVLISTTITGAGVRESLVGPLAISSFLASSIALTNIEESKPLMEYTERAHRTGYYFE